MNPQPEFTFAFACDGVPGIRGQIVKAYGKVLVIEGVAMDANSWFTKTGTNVQRYATRHDAEVAAAWLAADAKPSFEDWMRLVDQAVQAKVGMSYQDLDDYAYRDSYDRGRSPQAVASAAIKNAKSASGMDADCDLTVEDDWSPEAREAAAKARHGGSSHNNPDVTGSRSGPAEEARLQRITHRKKLLASGRNPHKGGNDADCDLTGDEPGVMKNSPYTPEQQRVAVARQKEWEKKQGPNWKAPKSNLHPSGEGHVDDAPSKQDLEAFRNFERPTTVKPGKVPTWRHRTSGKEIVATRPPSSEWVAADAEQRWRVTGWAESPTGNKYLKMHQIYAPSKEAAIAQFQAKEPDATQVNANAASAFIHSDESVSQAQHGAMGAAAGGKSKLGIPKSVGAEFMKADKGKGFDAAEMHKDIQELLEEGFNIATLKNKSTALTDRSGGIWLFDRSYKNPVGVETLIFKKVR